MKLLTGAVESEASFCSATSLGVKPRYFSIKAAVGAKNSLIRQAKVSSLADLATCGQNLGALAYCLGYQGESINFNFGAGVIAGDSGILLNNEMDDFTAKIGEPNQFGLVQGENNKIEPGKRPLSSMSPTIVTKDGKVVLVTGSPGGSTIPTTVMQVIANTIDYDMDITQAVNTPRIHYQGLPNRVITEPYALEPEIVRELVLKGYNIVPFTKWGAAESISIDPQTQLLQGANDIRKPAGAAVAY